MAAQRVNSVFSCFFLLLLLLLNGCLFVFRCQCLKLQLNGIVQSHCEIWDCAAWNCRKPTTEQVYDLGGYTGLPSACSKNGRAYNTVSRAFSILAYTYSTAFRKRGSEIRRGRARRSWTMGSSVGRVRDELERNACNKAIVSVRNITLLIDWLRSLSRYYKFRPFSK